NNLDLHSFPTRRSSDLKYLKCKSSELSIRTVVQHLEHILQTQEAIRLMQYQFQFLPSCQSLPHYLRALQYVCLFSIHRSLQCHRSEEHTSELQSRFDLV